MRAIDKLMNGGFGYGKICFPAGLGTLIITIIFPPAGVFIQERANNFRNMYRLVINFILTAIFYFPGLIHALSGINCNM